MNRLHFKHWNSKKKCCCLDSFVLFLLFFYVYVFFASKWAARFVWTILCTTNPIQSNRQCEMSVTINKLKMRKIVQNSLFYDSFSMIFSQTSKKKKKRIHVFVYTFYIKQNFFLLLLRLLLLRLWLRMLLLLLLMLVV